MKNRKVVVCVARIWLPFFLVAEKKLHKSSDGRDQRKIINHGAGYGLQTSCIYWLYDSHKYLLCVRELHPAAGRMIKIPDYQYPLEHSYIFCCCFGSAYCIMQCFIKDYLLGGKFFSESQRIGCVKHIFPGGWWGMPPENLLKTDCFEID